MSARGDRCVASQFMTNSRHNPKAKFSTSTINLMREEFMSNEWNLKEAYFPKLNFYIKKDGSSLPTYGIALMRELLHLLPRSGIQSYMSYTIGFGTLSVYFPFEYFCPKIILILCQNDKDQKQPNPVSCRSRLTQSENHTTKLLSVLRSPAAGLTTRALHWHAGTEMLCE